MATVAPRPDNEIPAPFFEDTRSLAEKLQVERRDWIPTKNADDPKMIFGLVIERGTYDGKTATHPTARILTADNIEWGVIAFHGWLHSAFDRQNPRVGDFVAIAYTGTKPAKKAGDNDAYTYALEVERNPNGSLSTDTADPAQPDADPGPPEDDPGVNDDEADAIAAEQTEKEAENDDIPF